MLFFFTFKEKSAQSHATHVQLEEGGMNPLKPCGSCSEWLKKVAEVNPSFAVLSFTDSKVRHTHDLLSFIALSASLSVRASFSSPSGSDASRMNPFAFLDTVIICKWMNIFGVYFGLEISRSGYQKN